MPSDRESSSNSSGRNGVTTRIITKRSTGLPQTVNPDIVAKQKHEEWTTSKKVVNHKTKQVETRVQRQIILEDGKVVADSGPQVTTKTTEDNKVEESENTEHKKTGDDEDLGGNYVAIPGSARVVSEKTESHNVMKETKEENMQLHDENVQELNGPDIHRKSLVLAPNESSFYSLDTLKQLPGKLTHYSSKSKKITDKEEVKETSEMLKNGEMVTNTTRTHHHEEEHDDEVPEDEANQALPNATTVPKRLTYNYEEEIDSLSDKIRKEKELNIIRDIAAERRDPVTRKALSIEEEEEIRNSETNRWLENHFGSDESDIAEPTHPKTGGNVINIRMSSTPKTNEQSSRVTKIKDEIDSRLFKSATTANIGSRFCGTREPDIVYTTLRTPTPNSAPRARESPDQYSSLSSSRTPLKTYYLGQEGSYQRLSPPKETPLRRVSAPVWKSTPTLNDPVFNTTYKPRFHSRDETAREERTLRTSPVQRSVSQRDISPRQRLHSKVTAHDDGFIHKFSRDNFDEEDNSWLSSKTLPRGQKFTADKPKQHRTSYSEVQSFSTGGKKTDRSVQVELSDEDDSSQVFSSILSRVRSPSPEYEITSLPRRSTTKKSVLVGPNKSKFFFGNANSSNHKDDYRKLYSVKSEGTTSRYSDGYGSLPSSKDRYHTEKEDSSIDRRIASFNTYGKSDNSYDGSTITSDYTRNNRYSNEVRTEERRKNSKNRNSSFDNRVYLESRDEVDYGRRKSSSNNSNDRRHFIDTLLTEEEPMYTRKLAPERRQRAMYSSSPPSPPRSSTPPSSSPPPRLIRADRFGGSSSLSPPDSPVAPPPPPPPPAPSSGGGTWKNRNIRSKSTGTPVVKMPNFTPLMSPVEIKNMANTINRSRSRDESRMYTNDKYMDVKPGSKNGTVVVEVRDWGNR